MGPGSAGCGSRWITVRPGATSESSCRPSSCTRTISSSRRPSFATPTSSSASRSSIWGTDDLLGEPSLGDPDVSTERRAGARLFRSPKEQPWKPQSIGYVGDAVRSLIDVGPAYLVATQAKGALGYRPRIFLLWKAEPFQLTPLFTVDNFHGDSPGTGFTYSRASRSAKDGVFFTHRRPTDAFPSGAALLRWRILFD